MKDYCKIASVAFVFVLVAISILPNDFSKDLKAPPPKEKFVLFHTHLDKVPQRESKDIDTAIHLDRCKMEVPLELSRFQSSGIFPGEQLLRKIGKHVDNITSPENTVVTLLNNSTAFNVCDTIFIQIEAKDTLNRSKEYGGDMFRVKVFSKKPYAAVNADLFYDFQNGTYLAVFRLLWIGEIDVQVILVHPAEAVPMFVPTINGSRISMQKFLGGFERTGENGKTYSESTTCTMTERKKPFCNFSDTHIYAPWYCSEPKDKHLNCSDWKTHRTDKGGIIKLLQSSIDKAGEEVLKRSKKIVFQSRGLLKVMPVGDKSKKNHYAELVHPMLRYCTPRGPPSMGTHGYYYNDTWYPFDCKIHKFTDQQLHECLNGTTIHFFGDSTGRQIFNFLKVRLKCKNAKLLPPRMTGLECKCKARNITLHFHFHGLPIMGSSKIPLQAIYYAANEINDIVGGPKVVIFLSYWAHFASAGLKFFEERLVPLRESLYRLLRRSPRTMVLMKGANTRNYSVKQFILISSDWIVCNKNIFSEMFS